MFTKRKKVKVKTINIGIIDRMFRFNLGFALLLTSVVALYITGGASVMLQEEVSMPTWPYITILAAIYPMITAIYGYEPLYALFKTDTLESFLPESAYTHTEEVKKAEPDHRETTPRVTQ